MTRLSRQRALFCLALAWLCTETITPALAQSPATPSISLVFDNVAPSVGSIVSGSSINDYSPMLSGGGEINSTITLFDNGLPIGTTTVSGMGQWSFTPLIPLLEGTHSFSVTATNSSGTSPPSPPFVLTVDTIVPQPPVVTDIILSGNVGANTTFTLTGTAEANSTVILYDQGTLIGSLTVKASGNWIWSWTPPPLLPGMHQFTAQAADAAANVSAPSPQQSVVALSNDALPLPNGGGQAQVSIISDTNGCSLGTQPTFGQANLAGAPAKATAPLGALAFAVTGCPGATLTVRIAYPSGSLATLTPYKFGSPSPLAAPTWFAHGSVSGDTVTYTVTDNGVGDSNLASGVIADPFAPMLLAAPGPTTAQSIPTLSQWAMVLLTVLLAALGLRAQRRKVQA